jgi:hypothetical protein
MNRADGGASIVMRHTGIRSADMSMDPSGSGKLAAIEAALDQLFRQNIAFTEAFNKIYLEGAARLDQIEEKLDRLLEDRP